MKLKVTTEYNNVDEDWMTWWLERHGANYGLNPEAPEFPHECKAEDDTSNVVAFTTIEIDAPESARFRKVEAMPPQAKASLLAMVKEPEAPDAK